MKHITVRPAVEKDASTIAKIHIETWLHAYKGLISDTYLDTLPKSIEDRTNKWKDAINKKQKGLQVFVGEIDQSIVGFCIVNPCRDEDMNQETGEIGAIYVDALQIGKGVGSALMEYGLDFLKNSGFNQATLWVLTTHKKSRDWYEKKGWKIEGKQKIEDRGDIQLDETRYSIDLK